MILQPLPYPAGALRWRARFQDGAAGGGDSRLTLQEVEFIDAGLVDLCVGGTSFSSSELNGFTQDSNAFDDNLTGPEWSTASGGMYNSHIGYQKVTSWLPVGLRIKNNGGSPAPNNEYRPRAIMVESSNDGVLWQRRALIPYVASAMALNEQKTWMFADYPAPVASGYSKHKLVIDASNNINGDILATNVEFRSSVGGEDQTVPLAGSQSFGSPGFYDPNENSTRAFNDNTGDWFQPRLSGPVELGWDYQAGNERPFVQVLWQAHGGFLDRTPNKFKAYGWDGSSWIQIGSEVLCGSWATANRTFTL